MSKRKGLSAEEKRTRLLELFHETKDVFTLKELEKVAPKSKGIVLQSVKEVLNSLVADDLVETDKIGSSTFFWSFPSKALNTKMQKTKELEMSFAEMEKKNQHLDSELKKYAISDTELATREKALKQIKELEVKRDELKAKLELKKDYDPKVFKQMKTDCNVAKQAINRWTDNVFTVKSWLKQKSNVEENDLNSRFGIPEDLDYLE